MAIADPGADQPAMPAPTTQQMASIRHA